MTRSWRADYTPFPLAVRRYILARCSYSCEIAGPGCTRVATIADHIIPDFEGGPNTADNGQGVCSVCHHHKTVRERARAKAKRSRWRAPEAHPGLI